jgi:DNA polymerase I
MKAIDDLERMGYTFRLDGDLLRYSTVDVPDVSGARALLTEIRDHKPEAVAFLRTRDECPHLYWRPAPDAPQRYIEICQDVDLAPGLFTHDQVIGLDIETSGLNAWQPGARIEVLQLYGQESGHLAVLPVHGNLPDPLRGLLADHSKLFVSHNGANFELPWLAQAGVDIHAAKHYDTLVGEAVLLDTGRSDLKKDLGSSVKRRLGLALDKDIEHDHWAGILTQRQLEYAATDALVLPALRQTQLDGARARSQTGALAVEMQLVPIVAQISRNGLPVDVGLLTSYRGTVEEKLETGVAALRGEFGPINPRSHPQLMKAFEKTGTSISNTREETLVALLGQQPSTAARLAKLVLDCREPAKQLGFCDEKFVREHVTPDGRIHSKYWSVGTNTGRFSSSQPNAQQFPRGMRHLFGNQPGWSVVSVDYSQIEVITAFLVAKDDEGIAAYSSEDIHRSIAATVFQVPPSQVTSDQRKQAKAITFGLLFGGGPDTILAYARTYGATLNRDQINSLQRLFFARFWRLAEFHRRAREQAWADEPVVIHLPTGLRRVLDGNMKRPTVLINTSVQGRAAAGAKFALVEAHRRGLTKHVVAVVHDEVVAFVPDSEAEGFAAELREAMIDGMRQALDFTVKVETKIGPTW